LDCIHVAQNPSSLAVTNDGAKLYVAHLTFGDDHVEVIDLATNLKIGQIDIGVSALEAHPTFGFVYATELNDFDVILTVNDQVAVSTPFGAGNSIAVSHDGTRVFVGGGAFVIGYVGVLDVLGHVLHVTGGLAGPVEGVAVHPWDTQLYASIDDSLNFPIPPLVHSFETQTLQPTNTVNPAALFGPFGIGVK
jgi:DNA-binding beta-propeller fold protein YncE